ncbi:hypothetical protein SAMN05216481_12331 [Streptomyces radiopugnans]|uniref:Acetyltransferase (GNAT) family protein n=1 Tax=Streptomyces radiopugnans TaxID=403935 RepID=A0A1H9KFK5_9ACTN|nr:hypothetical protein SAMN05216481_12331 [Streptomyces radiopugnans]
MAVAHTDRRSGVGRALLTEIARRTQEAGHTFLALVPQDGADAADRQAFFRACGLKLDGAVELEPARPEAVAWRRREPLDPLHDHRRYLTSRPGRADLPHLRQGHRPRPPHHEQRPRRRNPARRRHHRLLPPDRLERVHNDATWGVDEVELSRTCGPSPPPTPPPTPNGTTSGNGTSSPAGPDPRGTVPHRRNGSPPSHAHACPARHGSNARGAASSGTGRGAGQPPSSVPASGTCGLRRSRWPKVEWGGAGLELVESRTR